VAKAYRDLEQEGLVEGRQGVGTFVVRRPDGPPPLGQAQLSRALLLWLGKARSAGLSDADIEFVPEASAAGSALAPPESRGKALAVVWGGFAVATVSGVPSRPFIAGVASRRWTFVFVAVLAALAAVGLLMQTGQFLVYTYIAPVTRLILGGGNGTVTVALLVFGAAAIAGNVLGGVRTGSAHPAW
jgi:predicted MFS family arabinose efflux permease